MLTERELILECYPAEISGLEKSIRSAKDSWSKGEPCITDTEYDKFVKELRGLKEVLRMAEEGDERISDLPADLDTTPIRLEWFLKSATKAWSKGTPVLDDAEYDELVEELVRLKGESARPFMRNKQSVAVNDIVGTLSKVYGVTTPMRQGQKTYKDWVDSTFNRSTSEFKVMGTVDILVQSKFDGCSVAYDVTTKRFFTRGDYDNGESMDVTELFKGRVVLTDNDNVKAIKFEAIMSTEVFHELNFDEHYVNPRAAVSAIIMSRNTRYAKYIDLIALRRVYDGGGMVFPQILRDVSQVMAYDAYSDIEEFISDRLKDGAQVEVPNLRLDPNAESVGALHYAIDGVVVSFLQPGTTDWLYADAPLEVAIKILNNIRETKIKTIEWQMGNTGKITPVGILEPVDFDGITVDHVGLSTFDRVYQLKLHHDDTVRIVHNIVPYLLDSKHDGGPMIGIPTTCPNCGYKLDMSNLKMIRCTNPQCSNNIIGNIVRYVEQMKMMGISRGTIQKLYDLGYVRSIPDLYTFDGNALAMEKGFRETSVKNIQNSIRNASQDVKLDRWLGALPLLNVSQKTWTLILTELQRMTNENVESSILITIAESQDPDTLLRMITQFIPGIGNATWRAIHQGIRIHWDMIKKLVYLVNFNVTSTDVTKKNHGKICLSGTRDKQLIQLLNQTGYEVTDHFSSECKALIIPNWRFKSSKVKKAIKYRIPIYEVDTTITLCKNGAFHDCLEEEVELHKF